MLNEAQSAPSRLLGLIQAGFDPRQEKIGGLTVLQVPTGCQNVLLSATMLRPK